MTSSLFNNKQCLSKWNHRHHHLSVVQTYFHIYDWTKIKKEQPADTCILLYRMCEYKIGFPRTWCDFFSLCMKIVSAKNNTYILKFSSKIGNRKTIEIWKGVRCMMLRNMNFDRCAGRSQAFPIWSCESIISSIKHPIFVLYSNTMHCGDKIETLSYWFHWIYGGDVIDFWKWFSLVNVCVNRTTLLCFDRYWRDSECVSGREDELQQSLLVAFYFMYDKTWKKLIVHCLCERNTFGDHWGLKTSLSILSWIFTADITNLFEYVEIDRAHVQIEYKHGHSFVYVSKLCQYSCINCWVWVAFSYTYKFISSKPWTEQQCLKLFQMCLLLKFETLRCLCISNIFNWTCDSCLLFIALMHFKQE